MAGIDNTGFVTQSFETTKANLETSLRAVFGAAINLVPQSVFGQLVGIFSDRLTDLWQLGLALYNASFREGAAGVALDNIGALTGTTRKAAFPSEVLMSITGTPATAVAAGGFRASIPGVGTVFENTDAILIPGGGTQTNVRFTAIETGPKPAPAGTVTTIDTPTAGITSVTNPLDEDVLGADIESDTAYRIRQVEELRAQGSSTAKAIAARVNALDLVTAVYVFENTGDTTDAQGLPPHSFEVVAAGGSNTEIAQTIIDNKPIGIATYGTSNATVNDANGNPVVVKFSRPSDLNIYVTVSVTVDSSKFPTNGSDLIKAAIVDYEANYSIGTEVRASQLLPGIMAVAGVLECTMPFIGTAASPVSSTTIQVNNRQVAALDTSRVVVNVTPVVP